MVLFWITNISFNEIILRKIRNRSSESLIRATGHKFEISDLLPKVILLKKLRKYEIFFFIFLIPLRISIDKLKKKFV